jgi:hypothetical protein
MNTERELAIDELDVVTGGGTNGGNVVGGWNTSSSSGPSGDATIMTTEGLMGMYGRGNAGANKPLRFF